MRRNSQAAGEWDDIAGVPFEQVWRRHADALNRALLERWLGSARGRLLIKTDAFDEAMGDGPLDVVAPRYEHLVCTDVSPAIARGALARHPGISAATADVLHLPFANGVADCVVSLSTLDHFPESASIRAALEEIHRVLRPGGLLLLTLDNLDNPIIRLRSRMSISLLRRTGLVPYFVGACLTGRQLLETVGLAGFDILDHGSLMHCPRIVAVPLSAGAARLGPAVQRFWLRLLASAEVLRHAPTRRFTGHFIAILARSR